MNEVTPIHHSNAMQALRGSPYLLRLVLLPSHQPISSGLASPPSSELDSLLSSEHWQKACAEAKVGGTRNAVKAGLDGGVKHGLLPVKGLPQNGYGVQLKRLAVNILMDMKRTGRHQVSRYSY